MADPPLLDLNALRSFTFTRVLSESTTSGSISLLGKIHNVDAIVQLQQTVLPTDRAADIVRTGLEELTVFLENRPYFSAHGYLASRSLPDVVIKVIWPATETHIRKYTAQGRVIIRETPDMYERIVRPYIESFPPERVEWVYNILAGKKEAERVRFRNGDPENGFLILPDLKWDQTSMTALYLTVLVNTRSIRSIRDLTTAHLPLLYAIRQQVGATVLDNFGVRADKLRLFIHYQPSYYHFHVHVAHVEHEGLAGMLVDHAHILDHLISLLELSPPSPAPSILAQMTLSYSLGEQHGLYPGMTAYTQVDEPGSAGHPAAPKVAQGTKHHDCVASHDI